MTKNMLSILKQMNNNLRKNRGLPIVAIIFDDEYNIIEIESEKPIRHYSPPNPKNLTPSSSYIPYKDHAEQLCLDNLLKRNFNKEKLETLNFIMLLTPCNNCSKRIKDENFNFKKIYYLTERIHSSRNNDWKELTPKLEKYIGKSEEEANHIQEMINAWL